MSNLDRLYCKWKILLLPLVVGSGMLVSFVIFVQPTIESILENQKAVLAEEKKLIFLQAKLVQLSQVDPQVVQRRLEIVEKAVPSEKDALVGMIKLNQEAQLEGLMVDSIAVSPGNLSSALAGSKEVATERIKGLVFQVGLSGNQDSIMRFLKKFGEPSYPLMLTTRADISQLGAQISGKFELVMLWQQVPDRLGGEAEAVASLTGEEDKLILSLANYEAQAPTLAPISPDIGQTSPKRDSLF